TIETSAPVFTMSNPISLSPRTAASLCRRSAPVPGRGARREMKRAAAGAALPRKENASAVAQVDVVAPVRADIQLPRTADLLVLLGDHFLPLADPADGAGNREDRGEHRGGEPHRLEDDAGVEIDVGIQLLRDEIVILQRDPL